MADIITKDVLTLDEIKTVIGQEKKAMVIYDVSTGAPNGLDVEVLININSSLAAMDASVAQVWTMAETIAQETVDAATAKLQGYVYDASTAAETAIATNYTSNFKARVEADGGTIRSIGFTDRVYQANKDLLADTELLFVPEAGMTVTDGKIEKLYNLVGTNDAVQATAGNRPYVGGVIADGEKAKIKYLGELTGRPLQFSEKSYLSTDEWSIVCVATGDTGAALLSSNIVLNNAAYQLTSLSTGNILKPAVDTNEASDIRHIVTYNYNNGTGNIVLDGVPILTIANAGALTVNELLQNFVEYYTTTKVSYFQLINRTLSASESQSLHTFLSTEFPAIETIPVGSQQVATSNLDATVFGAVSVPEVQGANFASNSNLLNNASFELDTNSPPVYWDSSGSHTGTAVADGTAPDGSNVCEIVMGGMGDFGLNHFRQTYTTAIVGKKYRCEFWAKKVLGSGAIYCGLQHRGADEAFSFDITSEWVKYNLESSMPTSLLSVQFQSRDSNPQTIRIDGVKFAELGWTDLTTPAWCHYNNDPALGAIYGKLYNGYAVTALAPYAPSGFHIPSELEWTQLSENLGGNTVSGGKMKALYGGFDNAFATNESGVSSLAGGRRRANGTFDSFGSIAEFITPSRIYAGTFSVSRRIDSNSVLFNDDLEPVNIGLSIRLFSNTPHLTTDKYDSGFVTTDIGVGNLDVRIPFGCTVESVKVESETGITALSATLLDYNKANGVSLLTGKTVVANTPVNFRVVADQPSGYTDNYVRINGTKAVAAGRFKVTIKITPIQ